MRRYSLVNVVLPWLNVNVDVSSPEFQSPTGVLAGQFVVLTARRRPLPPKAVDGVLARRRDALLYASSAGDADALRAASRAPPGPDFHAAQTVTSWVWCGGSPCTWNDAELEKYAQTRAPVSTRRAGTWWCRAAAGAVPPPPRRLAAALCRRGGDGHVLNATRADRLRVIAYGRSGGRWKAASSDSAYVKAWPGFRRCLMYDPALSRLR